MRRTFSHTICASLQLFLLKTVFLPCQSLWSYTNKTLEQRVKASIWQHHFTSQSVHRALYYYTTVRTSNWCLYIVRIHIRIQSCAEWPEQHGTSSCRYNHDGFKALTETETEKWFAFIIGAAASAVAHQTRSLHALTKHLKSLLVV